MMDVKDDFLEWAAEYVGLIDRIGAHAAHAQLTFCGLSACVDATISLHDASPLLQASAPPEAATFAQLLMRRAKAGIGGEIRVDWPEGPAWLDKRLDFRLALGGTGPHAARVLTLLGAPALLALATRSPEQMAVLGPALRLAHKNRATPVAEIMPNGANLPKIYIFEFTAQRMLDGMLLPRSSRIIVRFHDPGIEDDQEFASLSAELSAKTGTAILSGYNAIGGGDLVDALSQTKALVAGWRRTGNPIIHLELAGYDQDSYRDAVLDGLTGHITSLGMSLSEFKALVPRDESLAKAMCCLAERLKLRRLCVHADTWAAAATLGDPAQEREALMMGCLLASIRAEHGEPMVPRALPCDAVFEMPPKLPATQGRWRMAAVAAPYLVHPVTTLGLGDTFMAGCLLVLGSRTPLCNAPACNASYPGDA
jgi:ADP-dependent phosphofructokinase/glucokinase